MTGLVALGLTTFLQGAVQTTSAKEFDITGSVECGTRSGHRCQFPDFSTTGPKIGILTTDVSGNLDRIVVNGSWMRNELGGLDQDDYIWVTVRNEGNDLQVISVKQHRCKAGTFNQGLSNQTNCVTESGDVTNDNDPS
jgi:hypothetical protein